MIPAVIYCQIVLHFINWFSSDLFTYKLIYDTDTYNNKI